MTTVQSNDVRNAPIGARTQTAIAWAVAGLGIIAFHLLHLYAAAGQLVSLAAGDAHAHDHDHGHGAGEGHLDTYAAIAGHGSGTAWMLSATLVLIVIAPVVALLVRSRLGAVVTLIVGLVSSLLMILDGLSHGVIEGAFSTLLVAVVGIGLPAAAATVLNVRWIRTTRPQRS